MKRTRTSNKLEVQNAAKTLFANIRFMSPDDPIRTIVVTSAAPNEGKSTTSFELAQAIATSGKTVVLVEADMRHRTLASLLNVRSAAGTYAVLTEAAALEAAVVATQMPNLFFLDTEPSIPNPIDVMSSKRYRKLVALLEKAYDYVIFDTPPVGTFVDAAILSTLADGTIVVVKPGSTKRADLVSACEQLSKADANVLGICGTFCEGAGSEYYYAYYTASGKRVAQGKEGAGALMSELPAETSTPRSPGAARTGRIVPDEHAGHASSGFAGSAGGRRPGSR